MANLTNTNPTNLRAHFDGKQIVLDESFELEPNTRLLVIVLHDTTTSDEDREELLALSWASFCAAYEGEEVDYPLEAIKEFNPDYEGR